MFLYFCKFHKAAKWKKKNHIKKCNIYLTDTIVAVRAFSKWISVTIRVVPTITVNTVIIVVIIVIGIIVTQ